jgi:hypothetical protein
MMPAVFDYRSSAGDLVLAREQQMLYLASVRTGQILNEGPKIIGGDGAYSEPLLCTAQDFLDNSCGFMYAIKETTVDNSNNVIYYWDQNADVAGAKSCNSANGYLQSNGLWVMSSVQNASRIVRLTIPNSSCYP